MTDDETGQANPPAAAILIRNPRVTNGEPPYALTDQFGQVQRLVEPAVGINLDPYVGQIVAVRHDTGRTLLASQLDLAPRGLPATSLSTISTRPATLAGQGVTNLAFPVPAANPAALNPAALSRPVVITQFGEEVAEANPTPEPIVLEEIIGDPVVQPVEGLPLPPTADAPVLTSPSGVPAGAVTVTNAPAMNGAACLQPNCGCCDTASPTIYFEGELLLLRMFDSDATVTNDGFESGSRFTLGVKTDGGSHWTARYTEYENAGYDGDDSLSFDLYDLEYGRCFKLGCRWQSLFTVGGRLTELADSPNLKYDDAIGPALGVQLRGPRWGYFHPLLGIRYALQFGESASDTFGTFNTTELAAGIEYQRRLSGGTTVFGRASAESILLEGPLNADSGDAALVGVGLSLGVAR
ncbi:MAG: hypothetical protein AAF596_08335 [Planctomycetota bacterium]